MTAPPSILLLTKDLLFITKVKEVARATGCEVRVVKGWTGLDEALSVHTDPGLLMLDLEKAIAPLEQLAERVRELVGGGWRCVSFFSHVHDELEGRARELGLGEVMPRSRFVKVLPELLGSL